MDLALKIRLYFPGGHSDGLLDPVGQNRPGGQSFGIGSFSMQ